MNENQLTTRENIPEEESKALKVARWLTSSAVAGVGPLSSAESLAREYLDDKSYKSNAERVDSLINWETSKNFTSGFITGLGGLLTLPVTIPASLGASWIIQARMAAAIARIYGHDISEERVQTVILMVIIGQDLKEVCKQAGIRIGTRFTYKMIEKIPGTILVKINQLIGFRLLTKAGERGIVNLTKMVPIVGGIVGGSFDAVTCRITGKAAKSAFGE